jgi:hypothetical protein
MGNSFVSRTWKIGVLLAYLAALALDVWLVVILPSGTWQDRAGLVLGIVGFAAFATGFLNATDLAKALPQFDLGSMTSPNLFDFLASNLRLLSLSFFFGAAFIYGRDPWTKLESGWKKLLLLPLWFMVALSLLLVPIVLGIGAFAYLIFVLPFTYLAYALVSLPLIRITETDESRMDYVSRSMRLPKLVSDHMPQLRVFGAGALSTFLAFVLRAIATY